jgi:hypothetical protein
MNDILIFSFETINCHHQPLTERRVSLNPNQNQQFMQVIAIYASHGFSETGNKWPIELRQCKQTMTVKRN